MNDQEQVAFLAAIVMIQNAGKAVTMDQCLTIAARHLHNARAAVAARKKTDVPVRQNVQPVPPGSLDEAVLEAFAAYPTGATPQKVFAAIEQRQQRPLNWRELEQHQEAVDRLIKSGRLCMASQTSGGNSLWRVSRG